MSAAPETKYTDRDVRESPDLAEMAVEYVEQYGGEFEYLIDMKMRLAQGYDLTTPMIRGILNCMRHDPRITGLPAPLPPEEGVVVELRPAKRKKRKSHVWDRENPVPCNEIKSHDAHTWRPDGEHYEWCNGVPWAINRLSSIYLPAQVKLPFVVARSGKLIHRVGPTDHWVEWWPNRHEWGFNRILQPELTVKLVCKYPSVLRQPLLLTAERAEQIIEVCELDWCRHCG